MAKNCRNFLYTKCYFAKWFIEFIFHLMKNVSFIPTLNRPIFIVIFFHFLRCLIICCYYNSRIHKMIELPIKIDDTISTIINLKRCVCVVQIWNKYNFFLIFNVGIKNKKWFILCLRANVLIISSISNDRIRRELDGFMTILFLCFFFL